MQLGRDQEALVDYQYILQREPENARIWRYSGMAKRHLDLHAEALADRIDRILSNETYAQELSTQARCHAQTFGWESIANQVQRVYRQ